MSPWTRDSDDDTSFSSGSEEFEEWFDESDLNVNGTAALPFNIGAVQDIILTLADHFDMRILMGEEHAKKVRMITGGLALAGKFIGNRYGGEVGAMIGGAVGCACGLCIAVTLRDLWGEVKARLWEMVELTYDYLAGMGMRDYKTAARVLTEAHRKDGETLVKMLAEVATKVLNKQVTTSIAH